MSIKEILGLGLLFVAISSCSEESPIDDRPYETGAVTLNFVMQGGIESKAVSQNESTENYSNTTADERYVNNCVIGIFAKGESGEWDKHIYSSFYDVNSTTGAFKISDIVLPINTDLKILAIANDPRVLVDGAISEGKISSISKPNDNAERWDKYSYWEDGFTWHQFQTEGQQYCTFNPKNLIKVGECTMRFNAKGQLVDAHNSIVNNGQAIVPLTQLASKVFLKLSLDKYNSFTLNKPIDIKNVRLYSGLLTYWDKNKYLEVSDKGQPNIDDNYTYLSNGATLETIEIPFYTYAKKDEGITILLEGAMGRTNKINQYTINLMPEGDGFLRSYYYYVEGTLKVEDKVVTNLTYVVSGWNSKEVNVPSFN